MKKILIIPAAVAIGILLFSNSCTRDNTSNPEYKCTCKYKATSGNDTTVTYLYPNSSEAHSDTECLSQQDGVQVIDPSGTCVLSETE